MSTPITYRQAQPADLPGIAAVFLAAFPESLAHYIGHDIPTAAMRDLFAILLEAEPEALSVAERDGEIIGYLCAPAHLSRVGGVAWRHLGRMAWRWVSGQYRFGLRPVGVALRNALTFLHDTHDIELASDARIFSLAVLPGVQGAGIGRRLLADGLRDLASSGAKRVRLEVRPGNVAGVHLYQRCGFVIRGRTRDSQGEWLVMVKDDAGNAPHA